MSKQIVLFARGEKSLYERYSNEERLQKIYFTTDTNEIIVNNIAYGINLSSEDLSIISEVSISLSPKGKVILNVNKTNGFSNEFEIPGATLTSNGLLSKEDKKTIDELPTKYATKEELTNTASKVYKFKGSREHYTDLPTENLTIGDVYNILNPFEKGSELDGNIEHYPAGTNVAWDGEEWDPLGGIDDAYSKSESDEKFVAWDKTTGKNLIILPQGGKIIGTAYDNDGANLILLGIYENGTIQQTEVGSAKNHLCLNSKDRPNVDLPGGVKQYFAYLSDIGILDMSKYSSGAEISYIFDFLTSYVTDNGLPSNINGNPYNGADNNYVVGEDYVVISWSDTVVGTKYYDLYSNMIPNATKAAITEVRTEMINNLTWEEVSNTTI